jgi:hypothetical protein
VLSIDPGPVRSGYVVLHDGVPVKWGWEDNDWLRGMIADYAADEEFNGLSAVHVAVEYLRPRGMPTAGEEMDTLYELGRLTADVPRDRIVKISRHEVKMALCGNVRAKDANIRAALIDRFGGQSVAIGAIKCPSCKGRKLVGLGKKRGPCADCDGTGWESPPGILAGITGHATQALALGITFLDRQNGGHQ